jgi:DNA primase large subunit
MLNPFSEEAKRYVEGSGAIDQLPSEIFELAKKKIAWKKEGKRPPKEILNLEDEKDVLSYYLLFLSAGLNFSPYSNEVRLVKEVVYQITKERLMDLALQTEGEKVLWRLADKFDVIEGEFDGRVLRLGDISVKREELYSASHDIRDEKRIKRYGVPWRTFLPLIRSKEMKLSDQLVRGSYVLLSLTDIIDLYSRLVAAEAVEKMASFRGLRKPAEIRGLKEIVGLLSGISKESYKVSFAMGRARKFIPENFPPCIKGVLEGVSAGSRNYAISVLLTSFLSYARAAPGKVDDPRISDFIKDPAILKDEIMPLIYQAAERCQPPLFEDQPMERLNVSYHLGLGLTEEVKLENAGASTWYFPPNCEKVQREAPTLCEPDDLCEKIKNPLNYYFIKAKEAEAGEEPKKEESEALKKGVEALRGEIVKVHDGSGLIERCPKCNRWIIDNFCTVHSDVEGVEDLRIKATLRQNNTFHWLILNREVTEKVIDLDLEKAKKLGKEAVLSRIKETLLGKRFQVDGKRLDRNFLVRGIRRVEDEGRH